jgi:hypothetical protein
MFKLVSIVLAPGFFVNYALAAPCDIKIDPPSFIQRDLAGAVNHTMIAAPHTGMRAVQHG